MSDEFVNELLTKLEVLESEKATQVSQLDELNRQVATQNEKIAKLERDNQELKTQNDNLRDLLRAKMDSQESIPSELRREESKQQSTESGNVADARFKLVEIKFTPEVEISMDDTVSIMGEFTNWMPEIMERYTQN